MFKSLGDRIWGLTFTLYPDGKFEIKYNYDKPKDYEETDEVITGEEINQTFLK
ncbi:alanyl-tRNA synthetase [Psychrobacter sp. 1501(2011)]|nr:alanyl-tRNA synthetase [Psychrobacter sp. 1501(2011)]